MDFFYELASMVQNLPAFNVIIYFKMKFTITIMTAAHHPSSFYFEPAQYTSHTTTIKKNPEKYIIK
jgi:hypothetical protein